MNKNNQEDMSLSVIVFICILLGAIIWAVSAFAPQVLVPWKWIRAAELAVTFQWETLSKMWAYEFKEYGKAFNYVNEQVWDVLKWLCIPIGYSAWKAAQQVNLNWTMEDHLQVLFGRFRWLNVVMRVPSGIGLSKKFPFVTFDMFVTYTNVEFPIGLEPLDYFAKYRENLPDVLKGQLGPMVKIKDKKIVWQDKFAEEVAMTCYKRIPNTKGTVDAKKTWREQAWASCSQNHRFERTFALGMLQAARDFGVLSAIEFLHLRKLAAVELKKNNRGLFEFWRAIVSLGGRCVYPEGAGIICHYYFEKALTDYLTTNPNDKEVAHYMRAQPWIKNALDSFFDVDRTVMQAPDVVSLRKAGLLRR
jgi:hypothetical protein